MLLCLIGLFLPIVRWCLSMYGFAKNGQLERNYQVGIKTRWTIANFDAEKLTWNRTYEDIRRERISK
ncbi:hypothetical protein Tam1G_1266 [Bifidobacterium imperatoris]|uniref:Uncharacterized protein n=1 Tax=Bifidobacterium imperatoris TaxID=2020965 RepID=A0A2N5IRT8_9BIFI|nr:hypothetical protein Tam1G_1266 [Bifidobacterium imperatoris]